METEPVRGQGIAFHFDPEARALMASLTPAPAEADGAPAAIDEAWLQEQVAALGYGQLRFLPQGATTLLARYATGEAATVKLAEAVDAQLQVKLSADGLEARLDVTPAQGGAAVTREAILDALKAKGVSEGFDDAAIDGVVEAGQASGERVAVGQPMEPGVNGWLESLIPEARDRQPRLDVSGHIDYRELGDIQVVHPGEPLMRRHPPTPGRDGRTLLGRTLPAKAGQAAKFASPLAGTRFADDDGDLLLAAVVGQPVTVRDGMAVEPVYKIDQVGSASGNISFEGNIVVKGDVDAGMSVRATGDIEIGGVVDLATLEAGGNIVVKGGVIGSLAHAASGQHHVRCGGTFNATYAQQAVIEAGDSIFIDDMALQCELSALNHITVGHKQRGHIIGGSARATLSITAKVVGSPSQGHTRLEIGVNPQLRQQQTDLTRQQQEQAHQLAEVGKLLAFAGSNPGRLQPEIVDKARATAAALAAKIAELEAAAEELGHKLELSQQARVVVEQRLHEGSDIVLGQQRYHAARDHGPCTIGLNEEGQLAPL